MIIYEISVREIANIIRHVKLMNIFFFKNCSCEKGLLYKLLLICQDEILNTTETSLDNKLVVWGNNRFIHTILLVITCSLLLVIVSIGC